MPFKVERPCKLHELESECRSLSVRLREHGQSMVPDKIEAALAEPDPALRVQLLHWWVWQAQLPKPEPIHDLGRRLQQECSHPSYEPECVAKPLLAEAGAAFEERRQRCFAQVTSWRWSKGDVFSLEPYHFERYDQKPGRWLKQAPEKLTRDHLRHGYDEAGRVLVIEERDQSLELFEYHLASIDVFRYQLRRSYEPVSARRYTLDDGRLVALDFAATGGISRTRFEWDGGVLRRVHCANSSGGQGRRDWSEELEYDAAGLIAVHYLPLSGGRALRWERPRKGETLEGLLAQIEPHIVPYVRATLERAAEPRPVYALALMTEEEGSAWLPPGLALGLEPQGSADDDPWFLEEEQIDEAPISPELQALCRRANKLAADGGTRGVGAMRKCLDRAAIALRDSADALPVERTEEFVVFVYDVGGGDPRASIRKLAGPELLRRLKAKGLL